MIPSENPAGHRARCCNLSSFHQGATRTTYVHATEEIRENPDERPLCHQYLPHGSAPISSVRHGDQLRSARSARQLCSLGTYAATWPLQCSPHACNLARGEHHHCGVVDVVHVIHKHVSARAVVARDMGECWPPIIW